MAIPSSEQQSGSEPTPLAGNIRRAQRARGVVLRTLPLLILAGGLLGVVATGLDDWLRLETLASHRSDLLRFVGSDFFLCVLAFLLLQITIVAFSIPAVALVTVAGGFLFGPFLTTGLSVVGQTLGAILLFFAARSALRPWVTRQAGPALARFEAGFRTDALTYVLTLRLMPLFPAWVINLGASLLNVPLRTFAVATFFGAIPCTFVFAYVGHGLGNLLEEDNVPVLLELLSAELLLPLLALACLALTPAILRRWRQQRRTRPSRSR